MTLLYYPIQADSGEDANRKSQLWIDVVSVECDVYGLAYDSPPLQWSPNCLWSLPAMPLDNACGVPNSGRRSKRFRGSTLFLYLQSDTISDRAPRSG
jgi:hypothetical protein